MNLDFEDYTLQSIEHWKDKFKGSSRGTAFITQNLIYDPINITMA
jgi:hypothetical protein